MNAIQKDEGVKQPANSVSVSINEEVETPPARIFSPTFFPSPSTDNQRPEELVEAK